MTETEATYKTEESLPECETGSVERMLEAAGWWFEQITEVVTLKALGAPLMPRWQMQSTSALFASYRQLLRNILAKTEQACNCAGPKSTVGPATLHRQTCPGCGKWVYVESRLVYG